jgi:uncharacterized protein YndB with AHSA1/START domain
MPLQHSIEIHRPLEQVFKFVADPRNDPQWCPRVTACVQRVGDGPTVGARYEAAENPTMRPKQTRWIDILECDPPHRVVTRQDDLQGSFVITYTLERTAAGTRLTQSDEIAWKVPRIGVPIGNFIVGRHIPDQLRRLKKLLEGMSSSQAAGSEAAV